MARINGWNVIGVLLPPMTGREAYKVLRRKFGQTPMHARDILASSLGPRGICAKQAFSSDSSDEFTGFVAVYPQRTRNGTRFVIEDGTSPKKLIADRPVRVARARPVRYSSGVAKSRNFAPNPITKETIMAAKTAARPAAKAAPARAAKPAAKAPARKAKAAPEPEPEDLELEEELEDEELEDELEDEEDEDLEDEDESDEDEEEDDEEEEDEEDEDEESEATDYTPYASKAITPVMADFAEWIDTEIFQPVGTSIQEVGAEDPVRLIAIAGTVRMEFQKSEFNRTQRERRQAEAKAAKAAPKAVAKAAPAPKAKVAAKAAPAAKAKVAAKAAPAKAAPARTAKAAPAKAAPAASRGPRTATRKKGPAPY